MIRYSLICSDAHDFEAWFRSSEDFDLQASRGLLSCPVCGDSRVAKALMRPGVVTSESRAVAPVEAPQALPAAAPVAMPVAMPPEAAEMIARLREIKAQLIANSENVGANFAEEARRMHFGEAPARSVHGQASLEEARALAEEGIDFLPLPVLPDEQN